MAVIVARPASATSGSIGGGGSVSVSEDNTTVITSASDLNFSGSFSISTVGSSATIQLSGSGQVGAVLYSVDGGPPTPQVPLTGPLGWMVNDDGLLLIVG